MRRSDRALVAFKVHLPRKPAKRIRKQLKSVLSSAGAVRDYDIAAGILSKMDRPGAAALHRDVRARRKTAEKSLLLRLKRLSLRTRVSKWCDDLNLDAPQPDFQPQMLGTMARNTMPRLARSFFDAGDLAAARGSAERLHDFRILAKKFRYTLELFAPGYGPVAEEWMRNIRSVQSVLGTINDYRTVLTMAERAGSSPKLLAALKRSERRKIREFRQLWSERFTRPEAARWIRALRAGGEGTLRERRIPRKPVASSTTAVAIGKAAAARA